jgi:gamma-glutamyltranspeptidase/glutathione hydrolase
MAHESHGSVGEECVDAAGVTASGGAIFGSSHVAGELGFVLQNRGSSFALDPSHANRLEPHKRPFHTIIPGFVTKDGKAWLSFGPMGGDMQAQGHAQVLVNIIDFGMDVQAACDAPRFYHSGSSRPTGAVAKDGGPVALESEIGPEVRKALEAKRHRIVNERASYGAYQAIRMDADNGVLIGGSESRHDGQAIGY